MLGILIEDALELRPLVCLAIGLCALAACLCRKWRPLGEGAFGVALGAVALALRLHAPVADPAAQQARLTVRAAPRISASGCRLETFLHGERPGRLDLRAPEGACVLLPGQHFVARLEPFALRDARNPGARSSAQRLRRRGVRSAARVVDGLWLPIGEPPRGVRAHLERARRALGDVLDPAEGATAAGGLLRALTTGDRARLAAETREAFTRAGLAHLLAVSGLHVGWVLALVHLSVRALLRRIPYLPVLRSVEAISRATGVLGALGYAGLAGLGVPSLRAAAMAIAGTVAILSGRAPAALNALTLAAGVVLVIEPAALFDAGFALSFAAVLGLIVWAPPPRPLAGLLHCTLGAGLATAPLVAALGAPLPRDTLLANALAVPFFGALLVPLALLSGLGALVLPALSPALRLPPTLLARAALRGVEALASDDLLVPLGGSVAAAAALCAGGFAARLMFQRRRPAALLAAVLAIAAIAVHAGREATRPVHPELLFLDVGHGDAVLFRRGPRAWLVDAGPRLAGFDAGRHVIAPALRAEGVTRLDALVITHADRDHIGGAASLIEGLPVDEIWLPRPAYESAAADALRRAAARRGVALRLISAGQRLQAGDVAFHVLWPPGDLRPLDRNTGSAVLRVEFPEGCALLPGDAPARVERVLAAELAPCALLELAHHGSGTSSGAVWLDVLEPVVAVASAGSRRRAALPHPHVQRRVDDRAIPLWVTRRWGAIRVRFSPFGPVVEPFLPG